MADRCARNAYMFPAAIALLSLSAAAAAGQTGPVSGPTDSLLAELAVVSSIASLPPESRCDNHVAAFVRVCRALLHERRGELANRKDDLRQVNGEFERLVADQPRSPLAWYGLAMLRLRMTYDSMPSEGGALMPVGLSLLSGAANALSEALRLDSTFGLAADALIRLPEPHAGAALRDRVALFRRARTVLTARTYAATANLERDAGNVDSAIAIERRALAIGHADSGLVSLGLARDLYRIGRPAEGRTVLVQGAATATPEAYSAYRQELTWVASPAELAEWDSLPARGRSPWIANFWQKRDIVEGRTDGARLIEHYKRLEFALAHYRITLPQTGRQHFHTVTPSEEYHAEYEMERFAARYPECFPALSTLLHDASTIGHDTPFDYYRPVQDLVDDRGVIWIRHGPPDAVAQTHNGEAVEVWRYERANGPLILQFRESDFQGSTGASTLVPTVLSMSPAIRNQVCAVDMSICSTGSSRTTPLPEPPMRLTTRLRTCGLMFSGHEAGMAHGVADRESEVVAEGARVGGGAILRARDQGRAAIDVATTTDSYQRQFAKTIHPAVQVYGLDQANTGAPRLVIGFAVPGNELAHTESGEANARIVYPLRIQVLAAPASDANRIDVDTLRQFVTAAPLTSGQYLVGLVEVPVQAGRYSASVSFTQSDGHGAIASLPRIDVPGQSRQLTVSDLVLGKENSSVRWYSGATAVPLNPLDTYPIGSSAELYFQLSGLEVGASYKTTVELFRSGDAPTRPPRLTIAFTQVATQARMEVARTLVLSNLGAQRYRITVKVQGARGQVAATSWLTIVK